MNACERWMCGLNSTTLLSMPTVPLFELYIFHPDTILARSSSIRALTCTTQVRSSGSQVFVGNRNHRAEPVLVLRRAPMNPSSDVFPRTPINRQGASFFRPRARRRDPGKAKDLTFSGPSSCPRESSFWCTQRQ